MSIPKNYSAERGLVLSEEEKGGIKFEYVSIRCRKASKLLRTNGIDKMCFAGIVLKCVRLRTLLKTSSVFLLKT